jgi:CRP/FNR family cyclic AMP-dependent transcriptional regulator
MQQAKSARVSRIRPAASAGDALATVLRAQLPGKRAIRVFAAGELLIREGDTSASLFILLSGRLKVFGRDGRDREVVYNLIEQPELIGELCLDGGPRSASVMALETSRCIVVERADLQHFLADYPAIAELLVMKLIGRVRHATQQIKSLALDSVYERVIALLQGLAEVEGEQRVIPVMLTQQEIALRVGATREMVNQVMRQLRAGGYVRKNPRGLLELLRPAPARW